MTHIPFPTVTLEPFRRQDCRTLARWLADPVLLAQTAPDWKAPLAEEDIERACFEQTGSMELYKAISEGRMVGHVGMRVQGETNGHLFHVIVNPGLHGRGYGEVMLHEIARHAFTRRNLHRLQLFVFEDNARAIACYVRAGFLIEGRHREHVRCGDRFLNTYSMALLRSEWKPRP